MRLFPGFVLSGFLVTVPPSVFVSAAPSHKLNSEFPWLAGHTEEAARERPQQQQQQQQQPKERQRILSPAPHSSASHSDRHTPLVKQPTTSTASSPHDIEIQGLSDTNDEKGSNNINSDNTLPKWLHRYATGFVAFGDSYSAGIGTTIPPGTEENSCRQGNGAYPYLIYSDLLSPSHNHSDNNTKLAARDDHNNTRNNGPSFQWLSCTGSTTDDVLSSPSSSKRAGNISQIDMFNTTSSDIKFATISIGGNDIGFFDVINACVFRFHAFYSGTCEEVLTRSEKLVDAALRYMKTPPWLTGRENKIEDDENGDSRKCGDDEGKKIDQEARLLTHKIRLILLEILDKIRWEKHPDFKIVMTGYARFFNADTVLCDEVSLGVWWDSTSTTAITGDGNVKGEGLHAYRPKLKRDIRRRMNLLVEKVNLLLEEIARDVNGRFTPRSTITPAGGAGRTSKTGYPENKKTKKRVIFVNYDSLFQGHRFCEEDVKEPDYQRAETWFFLPGGGDNLPLEPSTNSTDSKSGSSEGVGSKRGQQSLEFRKQIYAYEGERQIFLGEDDAHLVDPKRCLERIRGQRNIDKLARGDWGKKALCYMALVKERNPHLVLDTRLVPTSTKKTANTAAAMKGQGKGGNITVSPLNRDSMWYVPTYYGKTFHPRSLAHQVIKDRIYQVWAEEEKEDDENGI